MGTTNEVQGQDKIFDRPTCKQGLEYLAWWPRLGGHVQRSSPGLPGPVCRGAQPPRIGPGTRTGSPGCGGSSDGLGSHSLPAGQQPPQHCRGSAGLETHRGRRKKRLDVRTHTSVLLINSLQLHRIWRIIQMARKYIFDSLRKSYFLSSETEKCSLC